LGHEVCNLRNNDKKNCDRTVKVLAKVKKFRESIEKKDIKKNRIKKT